MKKIFIAGLLVLLAAGCTNNDAGQNGSQNNQQNNNKNSGQQNQNQTTTQAYINQTYGFEFMYPQQSMQFVTPTYPLLEDKIVQLQTLRNAYPKTNFGDAAFSVSAQYAKSLQACLALNSSEVSGGFKTQTDINGITFYVSKTNGAGAGNLYESTVYRTLSGNQTCIELNETIHTSNIGNYPPGTVTEVDKSAVQSQLDSILNSFQFLNQQ